MCRGFPGLFMGLCCINTERAAHDAQIAAALAVDQKR